MRAASCRVMCSVAAVPRLRQQIAVAGVTHVVVCRLVKAQLETKLSLSHCTRCNLHTMEGRPVQCIYLWMVHVLQIAAGCLAGVRVQVCTVFQTPVCLLMVPVVRSPVLSQLLCCSLPFPFEMGGYAFVTGCIVITLSLLIMLLVCVPGLMCYCCL